MNLDDLNEFPEFQRFVAEFRAWAESHGRDADSVWLDAYEYNRSDHDLSGRDLRPAARAAAETLSVVLGLAGPDAR